MGGGIMRTHAPDSDRLSDGRDHRRHGLAVRECAGEGGCPGRLTEPRRDRAAPGSGDGVVGNPESARTLSGFSTLARWGTGEWRYRITSGARRGETEVESLEPIGATARGETWKRTIGQESTLHLREIGGSLVLPSQITHPYRALVYFEPPLSYLLAGWSPESHGHSTAKWKSTASTTQA